MHVLAALKVLSVATNAWAHGEFGSNRKSRLKDQQRRLDRLEEREPSQHGSIMTNQILQLLNHWHVFGKWVGSVDDGCVEFDSRSILPGEKRHDCPETELDYLAQRIAVCGRSRHVGSHVLVHGAGWRRKESSRRDARRDSNDGVVTARRSLCGL